MKKIVKILDQKFYPNYGDNWDDKLFRETILKYLNPDSVILDIGAGAGIVEYMHFKDKVKEVYGVDPDPRVESNPHLTKGYNGYGDSMPFFKDNTFDVVFCDNVLEHIEYPKAFFTEISRVLKPGGVLLTKTPNKIHYMPLIASLTPNWFHCFYNKLRGRDEDDTFPTYYRINTVRSQRKFAQETLFEVVEINPIEGRPEYLRISALTYIPGIIFERIVNLFKLDFMKIILISIFKKQE